MRAMILAAGQGTRLLPLTRVRPKVLSPVVGITMLEFWIHQLHQAGCEAVVVNAFHLHEKLVAAVEERRWPIPVQVRVEPLLLGTGGGLRNVLDCFEGEPFVALNGDMLCNPPLQELYRRHLSSGRLVSLLLHDWPRFNNVVVDEDGQILGFGDEADRRRDQNPAARLLAFTGIHFLHPAALADYPLHDPLDILSIYRQLIDKGHAPQALFHPGLYWREMGELQSYHALHRELCHTSRPFLAPIPTGTRVRIHPSASIAPDVRLKGYVVVGAGGHVMENVELEDAIVWDRVRIKAGSRLCRCTVADGAVVEGFHEDEHLIGEGA